jgi:hypothetical protein
MVSSLSQLPRKSPGSNALELKHVVTLDVDILLVKLFSNRTNHFAQGTNPVARTRPGSRQARGHSDQQVDADPAPCQSAEDEASPTLAMHATITAD